MLFSLSPNTPQCQVFEVLNAELLFFLEAAIDADSFGEALFSQYFYAGQQKRSECWINEPTRAHFENLWNALPQDQQGRQKLFDIIRGAQNITVYFNNTEINLPELEHNLFEKFKRLTSHLFTRTKGLKRAKEQAHSSIQDHFREFKRVNDNSQLCFLCATSQLAQDRTGIKDRDQWRADYDHILCKDKYPIYTAHPGNFIPTCHICNSKAKGAKNILIGPNNRRRKAFYPLPPSQESCYQYAQVEPRFRSIAELNTGNSQAPITSALITFPNAPRDISSKIEVWDEVYQVPRRVEEHVVTHFFERVASDLLPQDFNDFCSQLYRYSRPYPPDIKKTEWRFWWFCAYQFLEGQTQEYLYDVWTLLEWKTNLFNNEDMASEFGI